MCTRGLYEAIEQIERYLAPAYLDEKTKAALTWLGRFRAAQQTVDLGLDEMGRTVAFTMEVEVVHESGEACDDRITLV